VRVTRPLDEIRAVRRRFRVTPNDVVLAACAGALRRFAERRGELPVPLKAMVPADVRSGRDAAGVGNRISFVFLELPCAEPDPVERLHAVSRATAQRRDGRAAEELDAAFGALARTPPPLQHALAHAFAHPRLFNLTISSVPGPAVPRYLRGCRLREVHSAVPLAGRHALSIGVVTVAGNACLAATADAETLPDADEFGADLAAAIDELVMASVTP
jgi:WS/DGAT/MGAT family acyltransferase